MKNQCSKAYQQFYLMPMSQHVTPTLKGGVTKFSDALNLAIQWNLSYLGGLVPTTVHILEKSTT